MNKTAIKNFAIRARVQLIEGVRYRAGLLGITESEIKEALPQSTRETEFYDIGTAAPYAVSGSALLQRRKLARCILTKAEDTGYAAAYRSITEEIAYTWFNRLIAIRFMEVNDYLPGRIRVLSSETGKPEPDLLSEAFDAGLDLTEEERTLILRLQDENKTDELFRLLFIRECHALHRVLPVLFEETDDVTELLFDLSVTDEAGVVRSLVRDIPEDDFNVEKGGQVEIIGWLYQYYNTDPKNAAFAKKGKITKDELPAVTQLFTPDWIVRYMVENSLGRFFIEKLADRDTEDIFSAGRTENAGGGEWTADRESALSEGSRSAENDLAGEAESKSIAAFERSRQEKEKAIAESFGWRYYLPDAEQEAGAARELAAIRKEHAAKKLEDITVIDPCMGSGHILVYAFDVLMQMYEHEGYRPRDAVRSILAHNLCGIDIDDRAYQLAYFAVMMKARQYDSRIFSRAPEVHLASIRESSGLRTWREAAGGSEMEEQTLDSHWTDEADRLISAFRDAKEYGSLLTPAAPDGEGLLSYLEAAEKEGGDLFFTEWIRGIAEAMPALIRQADMLSRTYDVVVTNPPYMGSGNMSADLSSYVKKHYPDSKADLFAVFIERCREMTRENGYQAMITQHSWMFQSTFKKLRKKVLQNNFVNLVHLGARAFDEIAGEVVQTTTFVIRKRKLDKYAAHYIRLMGYSGEAEKEQQFFNDNNSYTSVTSKYLALPDMQVAYWVGDKILDILSSKECVANYGEALGGLSTSDNERFLRTWPEVSFNSVSFDYDSCESTLDGKYKWVPHNKGGSFRRWYGNREYLVNWKNNGEEIKLAVVNNPSDPDTTSWSRRIFNWNKFFKQGISWSDVATGKIACRFIPRGTIFNATGPTFFAKQVEDENYFLGYFNSRVFQEFLALVCPGLHYNTGPISKLPVIIRDKKTVSEIVDENITLSRDDWDAFEISWDFKRHPLVEYAHSASEAAGGPAGKAPSYFLKDAYEAWAYQCGLRFDTLKKNEEELNRIFIDIYGLADELTPEVEERDVTVRRADLARDVKSLLSYFVGCLFGRYSLDTEGLAYAGGAWESGKYQTFLPDADNVVPLTDAYYLGNDIITRLTEWLKIVYGPDTLEANLDFIASALGKKGADSRAAIRSYFLEDFFADHCKTYSVTGSGKRPIYWLFDSGKEGGFRALIYLHRYTADTVGTLRVDYLHRLQKIYESESEHAEEVLNSSADAHEKARAARRKEHLEKQLKECRAYDEKISHLALSRIELDLDDGVKVNYRKLQTAGDGKFYEVLAASKEIMGKK